MISEAFVFIGEMQSIPRRDRPTLPDFCNLGVALRILLLGNLGLLLCSLVALQPVTFAAFLERFVIGAATVEPVLIASLVVLCPLRQWLVRFGYWRGVAAVMLAEMALAFGFGLMTERLTSGYVFGAMSGAGGGAGSGTAGAWLNGPLRDMLVAAAAAAVILYYFYLRARAFSPAISEARLMALQARIRPHFLFNSLTAVLSLMRAEPRRAERALEDLADLFRALLREERRVVRLSDEIALCKRYLDIETLRLGERLRIEWQVDDGALDAAVPPLVLQPLVENAVHHGIEPQSEAGTVQIHARRRGNQIEIDIINPRHEGNTQPPGRAGNHMALDNVRERLALLFDVEARLDTFEEAATYKVRITLPVTEVRGDGQRMLHAMADRQLDKPLGDEQARTKTNENTHS